MKLFISYKFTGENLDDLKSRLHLIYSALQKKGIDYYCSFDNENLFKERNLDAKEIMIHALNELDNCDILLAWVNSDNKSEGMLIEVGYAIARNKTVILLKKEGIYTHSLTGVANKVIEYKDESEIYDVLQASL